MNIGQQGSSSQSVGKQEKKTIPIISQGMC